MHTEDMKKLLLEERADLEASRAFWPEPRPSRETVKRYCHRGFRGVQLESVLLQNRRYTSRQAVLRFLAAISQPPAKKEVAQ